MGYKKLVWLFILEQLYHIVDGEKLWESPFSNPPPPKHIGVNIIGLFRRKNFYGIA